MKVEIKEPLSAQGGQWIYMDIYPGEYKCYQYPVKNIASAPVRATALFNLSCILTNNEINSIVINQTCPQPVGYTVTSPTVYIPASSTGYAPICFNMSDNMPANLNITGIVTVKRGTP